MGRARLRHHLPSGPFVAIASAFLLLFAALLVYFGAYDIAADTPHSRPVYALLDQIRDRSIAVRSRGINPPADLNAAARVSAGAGLYAEMCSSCHLGPGVERSELSQGLYPQAPELAKTQVLSAAEQFWIIKHGVKLSAMPAWGKTHADPLIWDMVAFVRRLPGMTSDQYRRLVASAPGDHDEMMKDMPGMK
jgi:mono/diheme cytochrome c family protein